MYKFCSKIYSTMLKNTTYMTSSEKLGLVFKNWYWRAFQTLLSMYLLYSKMMTSNKKIFFHSVLALPS